MDRDTEKNIFTIIGLGFIFICIVFAVCNSSFSPNPLGKFDSYNVTIKMYGNYTDKTTTAFDGAIRMWNSASNSKISSVDNDNADIDVYFANRSTVPSFRDGMFSNVYGDNNIVGSANICPSPHKVVIWVDDAYPGLSDEDFDGVVLHEICHGMGVPHMGDGLMRPGIHDLFGRSSDYRFTSDELQYIRSLYP